MGRLEKSQIRDEIETKFRDNREIALPRIRASTPTWTIHRAKLLGRRSSGRRDEWRGATGDITLAGQALDVYQRTGSFLHPAGDLVLGAGLALLVAGIVMMARVTTKYTVRRR